MTISELRNEIGKAEDKTWFLESTTVQISYPHIDFQVELVGIPAIYEFVSRQSKGWNEINSELTLPAILQSSRENFNTVRSRIVDFVTRNVQGSATHIRNNGWAQIKEQIQQQVYNGSQVFIYDCAETEFLVDLNKRFPNSTDMAYRFIAQKQINTNNFNADQFTGIIQAYEFKLQGNSLKKRRDNEKVSLGKIRNEFNRYINEAEQNLTGHINHSKESVENYAKTIDSLLENKEIFFDGWFEETRSDFEVFNEAVKKSMSDNELLYKEKLKLEAPATYWRDRATKLRGEGKNWLIALIITSVISIFALGAVLFFISDGTLKDLFDKTGSAVRWSIVFVTLVSFLAYGIRTFAKLTFSSYHLVRDAEEREQLTYVYLALKKEKNIDDTERHLIMQSIFSRADTGLLKEDSSPTMPSFMEKIIGGK
tara:strand:- start:359 stop:1633 length:1275 start_codon:yes stop_codon:yes gene_type:complete